MLWEGKDTTDTLGSGVLLVIEQDERRLGREKRFRRRSVRGGLAGGRGNLTSLSLDDCPEEDDDCLESGDVGLRGGVSSSCGIMERTRNLVSRFYEGCMG